MRTVPKANFPKLTPVAKLTSVECDGQVSLADVDGRIVARISRDAWAVLQKIDGALTVDAIADAVELPGHGPGHENAVWRHLDELAEAGLIKRLAPPAAPLPLRRREVLSRALLAGGALGLAAVAAPAFAASEQEQKKGKEERLKVKTKSASESHEKAKSSQESDAKHRELSAREEAHKKASKSNFTPQPPNHGPSDKVKKGFVEDKTAKEEQKK